MSFAPGDEVVCVNDEIIDRHLAWIGEIRRGQHYIVRWAGPIAYPYFNVAEYPGVRLVGIIRCDSVDTPFNAPRFRPVRHEAIEVFRQMCVSTKPLVKIE